MKQRNSRSAFTLIEILVVISIISILMAITIGVAGAVTRKAARAKAVAEVGSLLQELDLMKADMGSYPTSRSVSGVPTVPQAFFDWYEDKYGDGDGVADADDRIYSTMETSVDSGETYPVDPWGNPYVYIYDSSNPFIIFVGSKGADGSWGDGSPNNSSNFGNGDDISTKKGLSQ